MSKHRFAWPLAVLALVVAVGCSEPAPTGSTTSQPASTAVTIKGCASADLLECARQGSLADFVPDKPVKATGTPIKLGMINQENTPAGSFPELSQADRAAIAWVNEQLGGIDGHPIELEVCNTKFSVEGSTSCAQKFVDAKMPAVLGGIDVFGNGIDTLADNDIPYVGGIPVSAQSGTSPNSFQFSGGIWGLTVAFAEYASTTLHAKRVSIIYGEYGSITQSAEYGEKVLKDRGVGVQMVPYPILSTDLTSALTAAATTKPDAIFLLAADTGCKGGYDGIRSQKITAQVFLVGACVAPTILASVPEESSNGVIVNVEGPVSTTTADADTVLYGKIIDRYGDGVAAASAGTVSFRSFMNLYMVMRELGADRINAKNVLEAFRSKVNADSFMGHSYTCDGKQLAGLPALCSPQQILARIDNRTLVQLGSWIDVGAVYKG